MDDSVLLCTLGDQTRSVRSASINGCMRCRVQLDARAKELLPAGVGIRHPSGGTYVSGLRVGAYGSGGDGRIYKSTPILQPQLMHDIISLARSVMCFPYTGVCGHRYMAPVGGWCYPLAHGAVPSCDQARSVSDVQRAPLYGSCGDCCI